jgi:hypothetical protein
MIRASQHGHMARLCHRASGTPSGATAGERPCPPAACAARHALGTPLARIGQPTRRAGDADAAADNRRGSSPRTPTARTGVFDAGADDGDRIEAVIATTVLNAPISVVRDRAAHGVVCVE